MRRLEASFERFRAADRPALMPYITAGYPTISATVEILRRVDADRCACVELGIPFSDPIADGPIIQTSFVRALASSFTLDALFAELARRRAEIAVPLVAMVSYSIICRVGPPRFVASAGAAGIDGLIVPDLALEEAAEFSALAGAARCPLIMIVAPTTTPERRRHIAALSRPFVYFQSLAGVTGERSALPADLAEQVAALRSECGKPICVGFGVSTPAQVAAVGRIADGVIVGSAIVRRMNEAVDAATGERELARSVNEFIDELAGALPRARGDARGASS